MNKDLFFMEIAFKLALKVKGKTDDNPWVGCVIVKNNKIIGRGSTHPPGEAHAEADAMSDAKLNGFNIDDSTLYCSLEPCSFKGRTESCALSIANSGITKVVCALKDPHPRVNGNGFKILKNAGIIVIENFCSDKAEKILNDWLIRFK